MGLINFDYRVKFPLGEFEKYLEEGGLLIYNESLIDIKPQRIDIRMVPVKANDLAHEQGSVRSANMITLGLLMKLKPHLASLDSVLAAMEEAVSTRNKELNAINAKCMEKGYTLA